MILAMPVCRRCGARREVIIERLKQTQDAGIERIFGAFGFPGLPQWKVLRSIELFCTEVLPHFREVEAPVVS